MSAPEPGPSERVNLTGRCGQLCASAEVEFTKENKQKAANVQKPANVRKALRAMRFIVTTILPRGRDDRNKHGRNSRPRKDGRADGRPPSCPRLQRRRLRPA